MKHAAILIGVLVLLAMALVSHGQGSNLRVNGGTSLPSQCTVGDLFVKTDGAAHLRLEYCYATDSWEIAGN